MKHIKLLTLLTISTVLVMVFTGCKTTADGTKTADIERIARVTREATSIGTLELLKRHPEWLIHFKIAHDELAQLESADNISLDSVLTIISRLPIQELKSDDARLAVQGSRLLISAIDVPEVGAERLAQIRPIVKALREGLEAGGVQ